MLSKEQMEKVENTIVNALNLNTEEVSFSAWNEQSPSRQMRLISYSGYQKLLQIR